MVRKIIIVLFFGLTILSGCVTKEGVNNYSGAGEEVLRNRAMAYWNHRINDELDKSYDYEDPFYRKKIGMVNYIKNFSNNAAKWKAANIIDMNMTGDTASLNVNMKVSLNAHLIRGGEIDTVIADNWVKMEGVWYHVIQANAVNRGKN